MGVEASVRHTAVISPPVSALVAVLVAYWATDSWRVAFAALATIASAVVLMLAALVAVGWEFGVVEELCVTLLIGGSVDYCIHLAHAYAHEGGGEPKRRGRERGKDLSRAEKTSAALEHAAGTITGAALTTAASAATLLACRVEVLVKIGATIVVNTAAGYALALVLFSALMATFGD
jgi:predicted RND superfamily exporter protein